MSIKKILKVFIYLSLFITSYSSNAIDRELIIKIAEETIILYENNSKLNSEKIDKNLLEIKELIQLEIKTGNPLVPIDIYLFLRGIVKDDIYSLQSLLSQSETQEIESDLTKLINYSIAKKLALALKENRISIKTKFIIKNLKENNNCKIYLNGFLILDTKKLYSPAGIPLYIGSYCNDKTFEIQKIRSGESQEKLNIIFNHYTENEKFPSTIPNPNPAKQKSKEVSSISNNTNQKSSEKIIQNDDNSSLKTTPEKSKSLATCFQIGTGMGILRDFGTLSSHGVKNINFPRGGFIYSNSYFKYKYFLIAFDFSKIKLTEKYQLYFMDTGKEKEEELIGAGYFLRPSIGVSFPIIQLSESLKIESNLLGSITFLNTSYTPANKFGYGIHGYVGPWLQFANGFGFNFKVGVGQTFGELNGFNLEAQTQLGFSF